MIFVIYMICMNHIHHANQINHSSDKRKEP